MHLKRAADDLVGQGQQMYRAALYRYHSILDAMARWNFFDRFWHEPKLLAAVSISYALLLQLLLDVVSTATDLQFRLDESASYHSLLLKQIHLKQVLSILTCVPNCLPWELPTTETHLLHLTTLFEVGTAVGLIYSQPFLKLLQKKTPEDRYLAHDIEAFERIASDLDFLQRLSQGHVEIWSYLSRCQLPVRVFDSPIFEQFESLRRLRKPGGTPQSMS